MLTDQLQKLQAQLDRNMATTAAPTRYTINLDGTLEKWYLEHDGGEIIYLRKTPRPKWNCGMKEFPAAEAAGKDAPETDPHFYMAKAHLFHALQVEKSKH